MSVARAASAHQKHWTLSFDFICFVNGLTHFVFQELPRIIALDANQQAQQTQAHVETCLAASLVSSD
jgi:hypothetical protein